LQTPSKKKGESNGKLQQNKKQTSTISRVMHMNLARNGCQRVIFSLFLMLFCYFDVSSFIQTLPVLVV